jgi:hypothetical protein
VAIVVNIDSGQIAQLQGCDRPRAARKPKMQELRSRQAADKIPSLRLVPARGCLVSRERASNCQIKRHGLASALQR